MKKTFTLMLAIICMAFGTARGGLLQDSWRYRLTVSVETPEGLKSGSAVREVTVQKGLNLTPQMRPQAEVKGEAVVVDLGKRGVLFMLVDGDYGADILFKKFPDGRMKGEATLLPDEYPTFVRFRDLDNPKSMQEVRGAETFDKIKKALPNRDMVPFGQAFGDGVKIHEVTIEITKAPITWGIEKWIPWLPSRMHGGGFLGGDKNKSMDDDPTGPHLQGGAFSVGKF
jgi:hypothetical protein